MSAELDKVSAIQNRLNELKDLCERNAAAREAGGAYDDELLAECLDVLEYATFQDGRYGQAENYEKFMRPAQKLVVRLATRLARKPYAAQCPTCRGYELERSWCETCTRTGVVLAERELPAAAP